MPWSELEVDGYVLQFDVLSVDIFTPGPSRGLCATVFEHEIVLGNAIAVRQKIPLSVLRAAMKRLESL